MKKRYGFGIFLIVLLLWGICLFVMLTIDEEKRGSYGDMFGSVNALFSGLAFAGLICTLIIQMKELKAQREELELTRGTMESQTEILQMQTLEVERQSTITVLNTLLQNLKDTITTIRLDGSASQEGYQAFKRLIEVRLQKLNRDGHGNGNIREMLKDNKYETLEDLAKEHQEDFYSDLLDAHEKVHELLPMISRDFWPYINTLKVLLRYAKYVSTDDDELLSSIKASFTANEMLFVFYLGFWDAEIKSLVEDTKFFEVLPLLSVGSSAYVFEYSKQAYGGVIH